MLVRSILKMVGAGVSTEGPVEKNPPLSLRRGGNRLLRKNCAVHAIPTAIWRSYKVLGENKYRYFSKL
jgi:hypothetical protein